MNKLLSTIALGALLSFTPLLAQKGHAQRVQTQTSQAFGNVGSTQNFVFSKTRKNVLTAVLKVNNTYQWTYNSVTGPTPTGQVSFNYSNTLAVAGGLDSATAAVTINYGHLVTPSSYQYQSYLEVVLDPATLKGTGNLVLPITTTAAAVYDSLTYTVNQTPQFISTAVLEFTTGK